MSSQDNVKPEHSSSKPVFVYSDFKNITKSDDIATTTFPDLGFNPAIKPVIGQNINMSSLTFDHYDSYKNKIFEKMLDVKENQEQMQFEAFLDKLKSEHKNKNKNKSKD
jgi:hypothetical protein